ncbi:MAG TPA: peptide deformylase [Gammaproteobacteria bacterium]|nr:peptide deformylase [Gammaproteobacteria bacterium]
MAIRRILRMGHPLLRQVARRVEPQEIGGGALPRLLEDMLDTLHDYGGVGLAAPQIGESLQLAIIEIAGGPSRYGEIPPLPLTVFINPEIRVIDPAVKGYWEGCLSIPGLRGFVERPQHVEVTFINAQGVRERLELAGFLATVVQHELDHLAGTLYVDRIKDSRLLGFEQEFERYLAPREAA